MAKTKRQRPSSSAGAISVLIARESRVNAKAERLGYKLTVTPQYRLKGFSDEPYSLDDIEQFLDAALSVETVDSTETVKGEPQGEHQYT